METSKKDKNLYKRQFTKDNYLSDIDWLTDIRDTRNYQDEIQIDDLFQQTKEKIRKITIAGYLITEKIDKSEPIRNFLRGKLLSFMEMSLSFENNYQKDMKRYFQEMKYCFVEILSCWEVCLFSGLVSSMNFRILKEECDKVMSLIDQIIYLDNLSFIEKINGQSVLNIIGQKFNLDPKKQPKKTKRFYSKNLSLTADLTLENKIKKDLAGNERQDKIFAFLKDKEPLIIRDISAMFPELSQKTIQRDLNVLVDKGQIKRVGEKRWTKYGKID